MQRGRKRENYEQGQTILEIRSPLSICLKIYADSEKVSEFRKIESMFTLHSAVVCFEI
jgi:hypothetical protein